MATATRPNRSKTARTQSQQAKVDWSERARRLLDQEIDFVPHDSFFQGKAREVLDTPLEMPEPAAVPKDLPAHLRRLCETPLLTAEQERQAFRRFNCLKYLANSLRSRLDPDNPEPECILEVERLKREANAVRDWIVKANLRLVMSVVKKLVTPQHAFDDLLSDGIVSVMQAVDKFDFARGFRFSTYAYRAITRNVLRKITRHHREAQRNSGPPIETIADELPDHGSSHWNDTQWARLRQLLAPMLDKLDRRERFIVRSRFALGSHHKVRTFQNLADKLGVSKERVRQLEQRALGKMQRWAAEFATTRKGAAVLT